MKGKIIKESIEKSQNEEDKLYDFLEGENDITYHEYTYKLLDEDENMIGGVCMTIFLNRMYIDQVIVVNKYRKQGYGALMLKEIEDFAKQKGVETYTILKDRERAFPLHIAVLIVDGNWNFYGYCRVNSAVVKDQKTEFEFEVLSLFNTEEQALYKSKFVEAGKLTGEVK